MAPKSFVVFQVVVVVMSQLLVLVYGIDNKQEQKLAQECTDPSQLNENANRLIFHLAGFLPDGYFERAKERLTVQLAQEYGGAEIKQLNSKSAFQSWRTEFLHERGYDSVEYLNEQWASASTMVWLENPFQVLGDSDALEDFYLKCFHGQTLEKLCNDPRAFFKERLMKETLKRTTEKPEVEPWEHEAHQGVRCQYQIDNHESGSFYVIILREWSFEAFESFQEALRTNRVANVSSVFRPDGIVQWNISGLRVAAPDAKQQRLVRERGTLSTNGEHVMVWTDLKNKNNMDSKMRLQTYVPFGYIPEGYLKKHVDYWIKNSLPVVLTNCELMTGGLRRVQTILATDGIDKD